MRECQEGGKDLSYQFMHLELEVTWAFQGQCSDTSGVNTKPRHRHDETIRLSEGLEGGVDHVCRFLHKCTDRLRAPLRGPPDGDAVMSV